MDIDKFNYKLSKYEYLASQNPSNFIYAQKVNYYQNLVGGGVLGLSLSKNKKKADDATKKAEKEAEEAKEKLRKIEREKEEEKKIKMESKMTKNEFENKYLEFKTEYGKESSNESFFTMFKSCPANRGTYTATIKKGQDLLKYIDESLSLTKDHKLISSLRKNKNIIECELKELLKHDCRTNSFDYFNLNCIEK